MGWVDQLPSGRYRAIARNRVTGKRETVRPEDGSRSFATEIAADAAWRRREGELDGVYRAAGVAVERQKARTPLGPYALAWARTHEGEMSTRRSRESHARAIELAWPGLDVADLSRTHVREHLAGLREDRKGASQRSGRLSVIRGVMAQAITDGLRDSDPTHGVKHPKLIKREPRPMTETDVSLAMCYFPGWLWPAVLLAYDSGMRESEVAGVRWFRINTLHRTVMVADVREADGTLRDYPKGKDRASVPLTRRLCAALDAHRLAYPGAKTDAVFRDPTGKPVSAATIRYYWERARALAGLDNAPTFHDLRHACATRLAAEGAPAYVIQSVLRHTSLATSQAYIDAVPDSMIERWVDVIGEGATVSALPHPAERGGSAESESRGA